MWDDIGTVILTNTTPDSCVCVLCVCVCVCVVCVCTCVCVCVCVWVCLCMCYCIIRCVFATLLFPPTSSLLPPPPLPRVAPSAAELTVLVPVRAVSFPCTLRPVGGIERGEETRSPPLPPPPPPPPPGMLGTRPTRCCTV